MGDLGMHVCHVPFRAGYSPRNVRAVLSKIIAQRPDASGKMVPCDTWDNATLLCEAADPAGGEPFPMTLKMQRIAPGEKNTWYIEIRGTGACARFSTKNPRLLEVLHPSAGPQAWQAIDMGQETAFASITAGIFEFGFSDAILQMWAAFVHELVTGRPAGRFAGCVTLEETALSHRLFTAALQSQQNHSTVAVQAGGR
jgi:predicted dehydrogenase